MYHNSCKSFLEYYKTYKHKINKFIISNIYIFSQKLLNKNKTNNYYFIYEFSKDI